MESIKNSPPEPVFVKPAPILSATLSSPNEASAVTGWQLDFRQVDAGPMETRISVRPGRSLTLASISMSHRVHQRGAPPPGTLTFGFASSHGLRHWQNTPMDGAEADALLSFGCSEGFDSISEAGFTGTVMSLQTQAAEQLAGLVDLPVVSDADTAGLYRPQARNMMQSLRALTRILISSHLVGLTPALEDELMLNILQLAAGEGALATSISPSSRYRALSLAIDCMESEEDAPLSVSDICRRTGIAWRTLDRAFKDQFGFGPKRYYHRLRLNRVRELLVADGATGVADAANRWGFWHMGQFAADYRRLFGELPSETLSRKRLI